MTWIARRILAVALVVMTTFAAGAQARDGQLDRSFGDQGQVIIANVHYSRIAVGQDGSIVVSTPRGLRRYLPDGHLDPRFGRDGHRGYPASFAGSPYGLADLKLDNRGRLVLFGSSYPPGYPHVNSPPRGFGAETPAISRALVVRLAPDGRLDQTFGEGGAVIGDFGVRTAEPELQSYPEPTAAGLAGAVDTHGRPLLLAGAAGTTSPCFGHSGYGSVPRAIVRLTPSGAPDPSFGGGDGVSAELSELDAIRQPNLGLSASGQPLVAGHRGSACSPGTLLFRLSAAGGPLAGFGVEGRRFYPPARFGAFAPSGATILHRGFPYPLRRGDPPIPQQVMRITPSGSIDRSFGVNGFAPVGLPRGTNRSLRPAAVDSHGRILMLGAYSLPAPGPRQKQAFIVVERLLRSGEVDPSFGRGGTLSVPIHGADVLGHNQAFLDGQGRLTVLTSVRGAGRNDFREPVMVRFLLDR